ncbi:Actin-related protein 10 [Trichinella pseudospiralis]|uniref:Actin-related protein 10 n=2 Tax=Trichinella pseudospiralis TaxID=6337 RepID=A0A0V1K3N9_TRIPS|nr:Actin-related protein 10 [Trichinella pseudospiralis]KRY89449.1 Actin-related protein 10 [Trichinella pseudospiralis]KRZ24118.1 Actin-related protein 10 [Trichinella pseudospiralis]KRZ41844.1 Actin-related protein 10 [Trichinella pseudospiralis]
MSIFEGLTSYTEKKVIVLDIGTALTKYGFSSELVPRGIISTTSALNTLAVTSFSIQEEQTRLQMVIDFFDSIFFRQLLITPAKERIVIVESVITPTLRRDLIAKVLFTRFDIANICFPPIHLCAAFPLGTQTALVVDVGNYETQVMAIFDGVPLIQTFQVAPVASRAVLKRLRELIINRCFAYLQDGMYPASECVEVYQDHILEDIKAKICFVTNMERGHMYDKAENEQDAEKPTPPPNVEYVLDEDKILIIDGCIRELAAEIIFLYDEDGNSIPQLIIESILRCPIDIRKVVAERILVIGGGCMMPGFMARLKEELLDNLNRSDRFAEKTAIRKVKFFKSPAAENYMAWLGGSVIGSLDIVPYRSVSLLNMQNGCIPDWSTSFTFNPNNNS